MVLAQVPNNLDPSPVPKNNMTIRQYDLVKIKQVPKGRVKIYSLAK